MEELKKLVQIIQRSGKKESNLLDFTNKSPYTEWQLYSGVADGLITGNQDAHKIIYKGKKTANGVTMLKHRLKKKLLNQLFFLDEDITSTNKTQVKEQECFAKVYQARILINNGANDFALRILRQALATAHQFEFLDVNYLCLRSLLHIYANQGNTLEFKKTNQELIVVSHSLKGSQQSERMFLEAKVELSHSISSRKRYLLLIEDVLKKMEVLWREHETFDTFYDYYRLFIWSQELKGDFNRIVEITNISQELLETNKINAERFDHRFNKFIQVYAYLRAKKLEQGISLAATYLPSFNPSSNNWFAFMENYILLVLHARKYKVAHVLMDQVFSNPSIKKTNKMAQERWYLFEAYLHFVSPQPEISFKWREFLENVPSYSKDKEGYNVAILILQVMYSVGTNDIEALDYRMEALKKYAHKHLKDSFSDRSRTFFKLLAILVKNEFSFGPVQKKGQTYYQKLLRLSPPGDAYAEIEIIPYEHLWELILQRLQEKALQK